MNIIERIPTINTFPRRITSYNVCYTKLLRALCAAQLGTANAEELLSEYIASRPGGFVGNLSQYELGTIYYTQSKHRQAQKAFNEVAPDMRNNFV